MAESAYELVEVADGIRSIRSREHRETFHPVIGPAAEAEALYVRQGRLIDRVRSNKGTFVIWDVGLGAAANALAVLRATRDLECSICMVSFDRTLEPLRFALEHNEALGYFEAYQPLICALLNRGSVQRSDGKQSVTWSVHLDDFPGLLAGSTGVHLPRPHLVMFDPFSPAKNPEMWTEPLFSRMFTLLQGRDCVMPTFSRSTMFRVSLLVAGFYVGIGLASGRKDETTVAATKLDLVDRPLDRVWLAKAARSNSAEPLQTGAYRQVPLSVKTLAQLRRHPQFKKGCPA